jgi:serine/threonine-protein kinase
MDRWNFGYFSILRFLLPLARSAKVKWFRRIYREETQDRDVPLADGQYPSIVAHSFGTYILGNALLKYDWLTFNKVILCGSILPQDFPWDKLIERGQVQAVRNEYGMKDIWTGLVRWFVAGTGPSGRRGFKCSHKRVEQEEFVYDHSEYFDKGHMEAKWLPFLNRDLSPIPKSAIVVDMLRTSRPWAMYALYGLLLLSLSCVVTKCLGLF